MIKRVIEGLSDVAASVNISKRASDTEKADLSRKVETVGSYHQELLFNLKSGIKDTFHLVQNNMNAVWARLHSLEEAIHPRCTLCGKVFQSVDKLVEHAVSYHTPNPSPTYLRHSSIIEQNLSYRDSQQNDQDSFLSSNTAYIDVQTCTFCGLSF